MGVNTKATYLITISCDWCRKSNETTRELPPPEDSSDIPIPKSWRWLTTGKSLEQSLLELICDECNVHLERLRTQCKRSGALEPELPPTSVAPSDFDEDFCSAVTTREPGSLQVAQCELAHGHDGMHKRGDLNWS